MSSKAKKLATTLLRENRKNGRTWRAIAKDDYGNRVAAGTLNRIAKSKGAWLPKSDATLITLGLKKQPRQKSAPTSLWDMSAEALRRAIETREEMPPPDPRIIKAFVKAGLLKRGWTQ